MESIAVANESTSPCCEAPEQNVMPELPKQGSKQTFEETENELKKRKEDETSEWRKEQQSKEEHKKRMRDLRFKADSQLTKRTQKEADNRVREDAKSQANAFFEAPFTCVPQCVRSVLPCVYDTCENCGIFAVAFPATVGMAIIGAARMLNSCLKSKRGAFLLHFINFGAWIFLCVACGLDMDEDQSALRTWAICVTVWYSISRCCGGFVAIGSADDDSSDASMARGIGLTLTAAVESLLVFCCGIYWVIKYGGIGLWVPRASQVYIAISFCVWWHVLAYELPKYGAAFKADKSALIFIAGQILAFASWIAVCIELSDLEARDEVIGDCDIPLWTWAWGVSITYPIGKLCVVPAAWLSFDDDIKNGGLKCTGVCCGIIILLWQFIWNIILGLVWAHQDYECAVESGDIGEMYLVAKGHVGAVICEWLMPLVLLADDKGMLDWIGHGCAATGRLLVDCLTSKYVGFAMLGISVIIFGTMLVSASGVLLAGLLCLGVVACMLWIVAFVCMQCRCLNQAFGDCLRVPVNTLLSCLYTKGWLRSSDGIARRDFHKYIAEDLTDDDQQKMEKMEWCAICMVGLHGLVGNGVPVKVGVCGHYFHKSCLQYWWRKESACPLCRTSVLT